MATGKDYQPDPDAVERWRLARRDDLAEVLGLILSVPIHGQGPEGVWRFGIRPQHGWANDAMTAQFVAEINQVLVDATENQDVRRLNGAMEIDKYQSHLYEVGPAAQSWPLVFFELLQHARPILEDGAALLAWGYFLKDVVRRLNDWGAAKERGANELNTLEPSPHFESGSLVPQVSFTRAAIVALCYADLVEFYSVSDSVLIETFPRTAIYGYVSQDHPGGEESYLLRATERKRTFIYHVLGSGKVLEHYQLVGDSLTLLPLRSLADRTGSDPYAIPERVINHRVSRRKRKFWPFASH